MRPPRFALATLVVLPVCFAILTILQSGPFYEKFNAIRTGFASHPSQTFPMAKNRASATPTREIFDPVVAYSTFLGGSTYCCLLQQASAMFVDAAGNVYVGGASNALNFPTTPNVVQPTNPFISDQSGIYAGFLAKIDPTGQTLIFSTYLGGLSGVSSLTVDSSGNVYVVGPTYLTVPVAAPLPIPWLYTVPISVRKHRDHQAEQYCDGCSQCHLSGRKRFR